MTTIEINTGMSRLGDALENLGNEEGTEDQLKQTALCLVAAWGPAHGDAAGEFPAGR